MNIKKILLLSFFILQTITHAQSNLGFDIDYAKFNYDKNSVFFELYYSFNQKSFKTESTENGEVISADLSVKIGNESENIVDELYHLNIQVDTNSLQYKSEDLVGILGFIIPGGKYQLNVAVFDKLANESKNLTNELDLSPFDSVGLSISDIELSSKIIQEGADQNSIYFKNNLEIIPNPKNVFGLNSPILYYYTELYNADNMGSGNYTFERIISNNKKSLEVNEEDLSSFNTAIVKAGFVNLSKYNSGRYTLTMNVKDDQKNTLASSSKNFFVYNPQNKIATVKNNKLSHLTSEFGILSEEECDYYFDAAKYVAAESEKDLYESLTSIDSKRKFLFEFWGKRDVIPETQLNEYKEEFMARLDYVNSNYGHRHKKGYKTDRGRVALIYGIPNRVESRTNEAEYKPYEIWYYDGIEGGVLFIFGDTMGISELELLHSTKRGEFYNQDWQSRLTIKGGF